MVLVDLELGADMAVREPDPCLPAGSRADIAVLAADKAAVVVVAETVELAGIVEAAVLELDRHLLADTAV